MLWNAWNKLEITVFSMDCDISGLRRSMLRLYKIAWKMLLEKCYETHETNWKLRFFQWIAIYQAWDVACYVSTKMREKCCWKIIWNAWHKFENFGFYWIALYPGRDVACNVSTKYQNLIATNWNSKRWKIQKWNGDFSIGLRYIRFET